MVAYEFYRLDEMKGYELLGVLPERRKDSARISEKSVLGWADKYFGNKFCTEEIYFIPITIHEDTGTITRPMPGSSKDRAALLGEFHKESNGLDEFVEKTSRNLQVDRVKCIACGRDKSEYEMQKIFYEKHQGICKMCFRSEIEA